MLRLYREVVYRVEGVYVALNVMEIGVAFTSGKSDSVALVKTFIKRLVAENFRLIFNRSVNYALAFRFKV